MIQLNKYPFEFENAFFISLNFSRDSALPEKIELQVEAQIKISDEHFPRLQVNLKVKAAEPSPLRFSVELVGLFGYTGTDAAIDRSVAEEFINNKGLNVLWPYMTQMIRIITGQMGMNPLDTKTPLYFGVHIQPIQPAKKRTKPKKASVKKQASRARSG